jgi:hypothetical protein
MSTEGVDCETMTNLNDSPATAFRLSENFQTNSSQRAKPPVMSEPAALPSSSNLRRLRYGGRWVVEPAGEAGWKYASPLHPGADRTPGPTENPSAGKVALTDDFLSSKTPKSSICSQSREFRQQSRRCRADGFALATNHPRVHPMCKQIATGDRAEEPSVATRKAYRSRAWPQASLLGI